MILSYLQYPRYWRTCQNKGRWIFRQRSTYKEPPKFVVANLIAEGDFVTALGEITMKDENGSEGNYSYCDIWRLREGKIIALVAFVIASVPQGGKPVAQWQGWEQSGL